MKRAKVLLADDHAIVTEGLHRILEDDFEIIGAVSNGRALVEEAQRLEPDVVVVDISMPLLNGIEAARLIRKSNPRIKIVFLTMHPDKTYASEALKAGGLGYVLKSSAGSDLVNAIRAALNGRVYITASLHMMPGQAEHREPASGDALANHLTARQREVLQLVAEGHTLKGIADILHISPRTVEFHKYNIMEELRLRTTAELTQYAIRHRIIGA